MPLAATTYYFSSKDELLTEALAILVEDEIDRLSRRAAEMGVGLRSPADPPPRSRTCSSAATTPGARPVRGLPRGRPQAEPPGDGRALAPRLHLAGRVVADPGRRLGAGPAGALLVAGVDGILVHELSDGITGDGDLDRLRKRLEQLFALLLER